MKIKKFNKSPSSVLGLSKKSKDKKTLKKKALIPLNKTLKQAIGDVVKSSEEIKKGSEILKKSFDKKIQHKISIKEKKSDSQINYLEAKKILPAVQSLLNHCKTLGKNDLFKSEGTPIFAQFETIAIPKHPKTTLRMVLPHSLITAVSDVVLIITDEKKHHRKLRHDDEMYIINYTDKLKELGVTQVSKVMTLRQVRAEYYTHETRRKFSDMYDIFLVDGKISKKLSSIIGKKFYESRKTPIPVNLDNESKVKIEIDRALCKTQIVLKSTCCTNSVCKIGHTDMTAKQISENLEAFSKGLDKCNYPGGWKNIKKVFIKTPTSISFPIYYSFVSPSEIENAELKQTLPKKANVAVKGELSTIGRDVIVRPDGSVEVEGVSDMKSFMHQLYRHAGFKDHEDLDLSNVEYKALLKELYAKLPDKRKQEEEEEKKKEEEDGEMVVDDSDSDDDQIEGEIQKEVKLKEDFEDDDQGEEDMEQSYMKQWEDHWVNQKSEDEEDPEGGDEEGEGKKKKKKKKGKKSVTIVEAKEKGVKKKKKEEKQNSGKKNKTEKIHRAPTPAKPKNSKKNKKSGKALDFIRV